MPPERKQSQRLTVAGLIAVSAATLLMMAWAIFPSAAFADGTINWEKHQGLDDDDSCPNGAHWVLSPAQNISGATLHVDAQSIPMDSNGNQFNADSAGPVTTSTTAFVEFVGTAEQSTSLKVSHCLDRTTSTTTSSSTTNTTTTETTTTKTTATETTTTPASTTETTTTETTSTTSPGGSTTSTTTSETTSTTSPSGSTTSTTPGSSTTQTTTSTTPGGSTSSTTSTPGTTVSGTTITRTSSSSTTPLGTTVGGTTVSPGGTAFTGLENVIPLGTIALVLMSGGTGLLWVGSRRRQDRDEE